MADGGDGLIVIGRVHEHRDRSQCGNKVGHEARSSAATPSVVSTQVAPRNKPPEAPAGPEDSRPAIG